MRFFATKIAFVLLLLLAGCFAPSKADIIKKAEGASTRADLESALGEPSEVSKIGPIEKWTYKAADGAVIFLLAGDSVTFEVTEGP
ncbi:hypothetical protein HBA54_04005 [Pelagibius litoralis]|uniref:SmpA / OmlA family protein n=1 Tax=Pelagibius litoralis TaxID=374515 RepID=A0A967EX52_9PROT|nr:hypothetical protein [Pelagibius litoralis]NIA67745.1 hypothetical protein [Pelagibius litoralis]